MPFGQARNNPTVIGRFCTNLFPVGQVEVLRRDGEFEQLDFLIDTGYQGQVGIKQVLIDEYGLSQGLLADGTPTIVPIHGSGGTGFGFRSGMVVRWLGQQCQVEAVQLPYHVLSGQLGLRMFDNVRLTFDVREGGTVSVGQKPQVPWHHRLFGVRVAHQQTHSFLACKSRNCGDIISYPELLWIDIQVRDQSGVWHLLHAYVDTGDNSQLGLPPALVGELGLVISGKADLVTAFGKVQAGYGQVRVRWGSDECPIEFYESKSDDPPKVGMKLLRGHRVTADIFLAGC